MFWVLFSYYSRKYFEFLFEIRFVFLGNYLYICSMEMKAGTHTIKYEKTIDWNTKFIRIFDTADNLFLISRDVFHWKGNNEHKAFDYRYCIRTIIDFDQPDGNPAIVYYQLCVVPVLDSIKESTIKEISEFNNYPEVDVDLMSEKDVVDWGCVADMACVKAELSNTGWSWCSVNQLASVFEIIDTKFEGYLNERKLWWMIETIVE